MRHVPTLLLMRGLPGSGKTTEAMAWVREDPQHRARSNRDMFREGVFASTDGRLDDVREAHLTAIQGDMVAKLLRRGFSVVIDDTNLDDQVVIFWRVIADAEVARVEIRDLRHVSVETCIERDLARQAAGGRYVGAHVIQGLADGTLTTHWGRGRPG